MTDDPVVGGFISAISKYLGSAITNPLSLELTPLPRRINWHQEDIYTGNLARGDFAHTWKIFLDLH